MKKRRFKVSFNGNELVGDTIPADADSQWIFIHGAGSGDRNRFGQLRALFANDGITSCSFDFIGHGETGGTLAGSSLKSRIAQASAIIDSQIISQPFSIVASSMGGYIAIKLTELYKIKNLILLAPAVYATKVFDVPFGPLFTEAIRDPFSWRKTDAWRILKNFKGNLVIYEAGEDHVIPREVITRIYDSAGNAMFKKIVTVGGATHSLAKWLNERPDFLYKIVQEIHELP